MLFRPLVAALVLVSGVLGCRTGSGGTASVKDADAGGMPMSGMSGVGVHGMYLFGTDTIYLSHLPCFGPPHDMQAVLEVTLADDAKAAYLADVAQGTAKIYTFNPKTAWRMTDLIATPPRTSFPGTIFHDHFEDGHQFAPLGHPIFQVTNVTVKRVVYFQQLDAKLQLPNLGYLLFGQGRTFYAAHLLSAPPDFDQYVNVTPGANSFTPEQLAAGIRVNFPDMPNTLDGRFVAGQQVSGQAGSGSGATPLSLTVNAETYLEVNDLAN